MTRLRPPSQQGIRFLAPYDTGGYSVAARRVLLGLQHAGIPFTWTPLVNGGAWDLWYQPFTGRAIGDRELDPYCNRCMDYTFVIPFIVPEYLFRLRTLMPDKKLLACTVWETDRIPHHWAVCLENADHILVPCTWNETVFRKRGLRAPVHRLPYIVRDGDGDVAPATFDIPEAHFVFYAIETWTARKALDRLLHAYLKAFTERDPVTLVLKTSADDLTTSGWLRRHAPSRAAVRRILRQYPQPARIRCVTDRLSDAEITALHRRGDCYVSLSHGEGWNLGAFDAAAFGKPAVITGCGGPMDYLTPDTAYLIEYTWVPVNDDFGKPSFLYDQNWAEPSIDHAAALMREVFENRDDAARRGAAVREYVHATFNEQAVIRQLVNLLDAL